MAGDDVAAVLFDMDGTLVDSEKIWQVALDELATHHGGVLSASARAAMVGTTTSESMAIFYTDIDQLDRDPDEGARWLEARVMELFAEGLIWRPGAYRAARSRYGRPGIPTALVTATVPPDRRDHARHHRPGQLRRDRHRRRRGRRQTASGAVPDGCRRVARRAAGLRGDRGLADRDRQRAGRRLSVVVVPAEVDLSALDRRHPRTEPRRPGHRRLRRIAAGTYR